MIKNTLTAAALGMAMLATPAIAGSETGEKISVEYRDLNLMTEEGQAKLDARIDDAARKVCKFDDVRTGTRIQSNDRKQCFTQARRSVETQMAALINAERLGG